MSMYPLFTDEQVEREAEFFARESYLDELRAEHHDPYWDAEPDWAEEAAAQADRDGADDWADVDY